MKSWHEQNRERCCHGIVEIITDDELQREFFLMNIRWHIEASHAHSSSYYMYARIRKEYVYSTLDQIVHAYLNWKTMLNSGCRVIKNKNWTNEWIDQQMLAQNLVTGLNLLNKRSVQATLILLKRTNPTLPAQYFGTREKATG